jgi:hypothetical protein
MRKTRLAAQTQPEPGTWFGGKVWLLPLTPNADARGTLLPIEFETLPFQPKRVFTIANVPAGQSRGGHGHVAGDQVLACVSGAVLVTVRFEGREHQIQLSASTNALVVESGVWARQDYLVANTVLLVLSSTNYEEARYFTDGQTPGT